MPPSVVEYTVKCASVWVAVGVVVDRPTVFDVPQDDSRLTITAAKMLLVRRCQRR
jgi:hypothetical protein